MADAAIAGAGVQLPCSPTLAFLYLWPPSPLATIVGIDACLTQCGGCAVCCVGRLAEWAGRGPTGVNQFASDMWLKQATVQNKCFQASK